MYNTMVKLRNKKAFTLVEMMAVIAIVAVLVAVVVPIIGTSTTKARAATNAANLRSVESELATMKVSNPDYFIAATETTMTTAEQWQQSAYKYVYNFWYGEDEYTLKMDSIPAVSGTLSFYTNNFLKEGTAITLSGVPTSVALSADSNMNMEDGTQMYIFLSGNTFTAAYKGTDDAGKEVYFDKDCFAEVAETGKFTGEGVKSDDGAKDFVDNVVDDITDAAKVAACVFNRTHAPVDQGDGTHKCSACGVSDSHSFDNEGNCRTSTCTATCAHQWECIQETEYGVTVYKHKCKVCEKEGIHSEGYNVVTNTKCDVCKATKQTTTTGCSEACTSYTEDASTGKCTCGHKKSEHSSTKKIVCSKDNYNATGWTGSGKNTKYDATCTNCGHTHSKYTDYTETVYAACTHTESTTTWVAPSTQ